MNFNRIGRLLLCFVLICALLINVSPIKAKADAITGAAIVKASTVTCNPYIICAAILIACGVYAGVETGVFDTFVNNCVSTLEAAGTWIKDGVVELLRTTDSYGNVTYYASGDFMNAVCGTITVEALIKAGLAIPADSFDDYYQYCMNQALAARYYALLNTGTRVVLAWCNSPFKVYPNTNAVTKDRFPYVINTDSGASYFYYYHGLVNSSGFASYDTRRTLEVSSYAIYKSDGNEVLSYVPGLEIGTLAPYGTFTDGSSARAWSETYANRGLYVATGGNQGDPDDGAEGNDGWKFLLPLTLSSAAILAAMSQTEQWTGTTPPEFDDYTENEELTVTPAPEFDGLPAIEIAPVTNPNPDPDPGPGTGSDPDSGGESAELNWWQRFSQWFLELRTSINELPNRFDEHFENLNNNIQEGNSKFDTWVQKVQTSVDAVAESILGTADEINATINELPNTFFGQLPVLLSAIAAVPEAIVAGLRSLFQELFVPSQEYLNNKLQELVQSYPYLEPIISLGDTFKGYLTGINPTPPVIWIDLGASAWYPLGGRVKFIDLTWYAQYKPTVDGIMGAFLWLWFLWRLFQSAPGIVSGASGLFGHPDSHPDASFYGPNMISGQRFLGSGNGLNRNE